MQFSTKFASLLLFATLACASPIGRRDDASSAVSGAVTGAEGFASSLVQELSKVPVVGSVVEGAEDGESELVSVLEKALPRRGLGLSTPVDSAVSSLEDVPVLGSVVNGVASTANTLETTLDNVPGVQPVLDTVNSVISRRGLGLENSVDSAVSSLEGVPVLGSVVNSAASGVDSLESTLEQVPGVKSAIDTVDSLASKRDTNVASTLDTILAAVGPQLEAIPGVSQVLSSSLSTTDELIAKLSAIPGVGELLGTVSSLDLPIDLPPTKRGLGLEEPVDGVVSGLEKVPILGSVVNAAGELVDGVESGLQDVPGVSQVLSGVNSVIGRGLGLEAPVNGLTSTLADTPVVGSVVDAASSGLNTVESTLDTIPGVSGLLSTVNSVIEKRGLGLQGPVDGVVSTVEKTPVLGGVVGGVVSAVAGVEGELEKAVPGVGQVESTANSILEKRGLGLEAPVNGLTSTLADTPVVGSVVDAASSALNTVESTADTVPGVSALLSGVNSVIEKRALGLENTVDSTVDSLEQSVPGLAPVVQTAGSALNAVEGPIDTLPGVSNVVDEVNSLAN